MIMQAINAKKNMAVREFVQVFRSKRGKKYKYLHGGGVGLHAGLEMVVLNLPDSRVMRIMARSMILALLILSFPWLGSILRGSSLNSQNQDLYLQPNVDSSDSITNLDLLPVILRDLTNEGLLKMGDKAVFLSNAKEEEAVYSAQTLGENEMDMISTSDSDRQSSTPDETFDFAYSSSYHSAKDFIDRTLKKGGVAAIQLSDNPLMAFPNPTNYKIVYLRRFDSTIMAMRKISGADPNNSPTQRRRLCGFDSEAKKAALKNLEDVLLEPPRSSSGKSSRYLKRTRYLPDLMGDSLEGYSRRVFIDVGLPEKDGGSGTGWFAKNYPTRNLHFDMYKIETVTEESSGRKEVAQVGMSDWLRRNVKEEEYVVMKAEAEVVEEMVNSKAIGLVDELFLECKPRGVGGKKDNKSRRAYWECLALYGRLRDEGVAVHQWWG